MPTAAAHGVSAVRALLAAVTVASAAAGRSIRGAEQVHLQLPEAECLTLSSSALRFVPCAIATTWVIGQGGQLEDKYGACLARAREGGYVLVPGCKKAKGDQPVRLKQSVLSVGGKCLGRENKKAVATPRKACSEFTPLRLWTLSARLESDTGATLLFTLSVGQHMAAYLATALMTLAALLVTICLCAPPPSACRAGQHGSPPEQPKANVHVNLRATGLPSEPVSLQLAAQ